MLRVTCPSLIPIFASLIVASSATLGYAQIQREKASEIKKSETSASVSKPDEIEVTRSKAAEVVAEVYDNLPNINPRQVRLALKVRAADAIWGFDESRGRRMMSEVVLELKIHLTDFTQPIKETKPTSAMVVPQIVSDVSSVLARRDPQLARELVREIANLTDYAQRNRGTSADGSQAQARINFASDLVESNPQLAAEVAATALDRRPNLNIIPFLMKLREKDPQAAHILFMRALGYAIRSSDWALVVMELAMYALPGFGLNEPRYNLELIGSSFSKESASALLSVVCSEIRRQNQLPVQRDPRVAGSRPFQASLRLIAMLIPYFESQMPQCANQLHMRLSTMLETVADTEIRDRYRLTGRETIEQIISDASGLKDESQQDAAYLHAMLLAMAEKKWEVAFRIADMFNEEKTRNANKARVATNAARDALNKKDVEKAIFYSERIESVDDIALIYTEAANILTERNDKPSAISLIRAGRDRIGQAELPGSGDALLFLATAMSRIDLPSAFELAEAGVEMLNRRMRELRYVQATEPSRMTSVYSKRLESSMLQLSTVDFKESLRVANMVEDQVSSMTCRIAISRAFLENTKQRSARST